MLNKICRLKFALALVLLIFTANAPALSGERLGKITGEVRLDLKQEKISARLKYDYVAAGVPEAEIRFHLNKSFAVSRVECRLCRSFNFDPQAQRLPTLTISLSQPLAAGERLPIEIDYEGSLKAMYHPEHRFLELGLDWFWYPVHPGFSEFNFLYRLNVKTDAPDFQLAANGRAAKKSGGWIVESKTPDYDIDLVLGENLAFERYDRGGYDLQIVSKNLAPEVPAALLSNIRETLDFYNSVFGATNPQRRVTAVIRPFPEISGQGGYFRRGYFILPKIDDPQNFSFSIAHELAHHWWIGANQQNAWLNESFAEYSALLALRRLRGAAQFERIIEQKKKMNEGLPPVYGFDRTKNRQQTPRVLYVKGALKLYELEKDLGEEKFLQFLQKAIEARVRETDRLIGLLAKFASPETADRFLAKLKE